MHLRKVTRFNCFHCLRSPRFYTEIKRHFPFEVTDNQNDAILKFDEFLSAGACAFYDYKKPIADANVMKIAMQYADNFDGLVCSYPQDNSISRNGVVNENITSTTLGLNGNPNLAEALQISRDLQLLEYTGGKLHIPTISTAEGVQLIREAKNKKLNT